MTKAREQADQGGPNERPGAEREPWIRPTLSVLGPVERIVTAKEISSPGDGQIWFENPVDS